MHKEGILVKDIEGFNFYPNSEWPFDFLPSGVNNCYDYQGLNPQCVFDVAHSHGIWLGVQGARVREFESLPRLL